MLSNIETKNNIELSKLIEFGYDLHKREMDPYEWKIPNFEFYNGNSCPMKKFKNGGIFGMRKYPNHSQSYICTTLGVCIGKQKWKKFNVEYAQMIQTNNKDFSLHFFNLKKVTNKNGDEILSYDSENNWDHMSDDDKLKYFIKTMEFVGFKKEDILAVLNGTLTAREAYMNVAPEKIKNFQWVNKSRRMFEFDGNVAVEGNFSSMDMDEFPFPFEGQPILDCSKVKTTCIHFGNNHRKIKLINVNSNPYSIQFTNLKNAIIEEPIDLSKVDATDTKFGHHTVINLEYSKANLKTIDLTLAVNEQGERYVVNEFGTVQFDSDNITYENNDSLNNIQIFANADNIEMTQEAINNETDGIGLVRTEHIFTNIDDVKIMIELLESGYYKENPEHLKRFKNLQKEQVRNILLHCKNKPVVFRLLDFKLKDYLKTFGLNINYLKEYIDKMRGSYILCNKEKLLVAQIEAIIEVAIEFDIEVNLLVPLFNSINNFIKIKKIAGETANKYNLKKLRIGAMVETLEISNDADELAKVADFISIGTNDLTESITGLSRDTNSIEFQTLTEDIKSIIEEVIYRARATNPNIIIGICGEHSNYIENIGFYNNIGINYITCSPDFIKVNKEILDNSPNLSTGNVQQLLRIKK